MSLCFDPLVGRNLSVIIDLGQWALYCHLSLNHMAVRNLCNYWLVNQVPDLLKVNYFCSISFIFMVAYFCITSCRMLRKVS